MYSQRPQSAVHERYDTLAKRAQRDTLHSEAFTHSSSLLSLLVLVSGMVCSVPDDFARAGTPLRLLNYEKHAVVSSVCLLLRDETGFRSCLQGM